jgi:hypothetical protein
MLSTLQIKKSHFLFINSFQNASKSYENFKNSKIRPRKFCEIKNWLIKEN